MKHIYLILTTTLSIFSYAQDGSVGIGTENPHQSAVLDIVSDNKGFLAPHIALTGKTDATTIPNPTNGTMVYNTSKIIGNAETSIDPGLHYWENDSWKNARVSTAIELTQNGQLKSYLGFETEPYNPSMAANFTSNQVEFVLEKCINWPVNNHTYCTYSTKRQTKNDTGINWQQAFNIAKERKGYLTTITNLAEWNFLYDNVIKNLPNSFWIGYNKIDFSGNPTEFAWITGEKQKIDWTTLTTEDYFRGGEPNNSGNNEGCVHVVSKAIGDQEGKRGWNDLPCSSTTQWNNEFMSHIIIEYNPN